MTCLYDGYDNKTSYEYNALGNIQKVIQPDGAVTQYSYNYMGLLEKVTDDCGTVYKASYDSGARLVYQKDVTTGEEIFDNKQRISVQLDYDKNGREVLRKFGNGTSEATLYDGLTFDV